MTQMDDHDALTKLSAQFEAFIHTQAANNIGSVERDTRIEEQVKAINGKVAKHEERLVVLWTDRSIWNWATRLAIIATPIVVVVVNYLTN